MTQTRLYVGQVKHERVRPRRHRLSYGIFMLLLDLDDLEALDRRLKLFSLARFNLMSFHADDHADEPGIGVKASVLARLAERGIDLPDARVSLLCMPRVLGHGFNPLSVYFCRDAQGRLVAIVHAVRNTFGQRHDYVLPVHGERGGWVRQASDKIFHVSPFMPMDLRYVFEIAVPAETTHVGIDVFDADGLMLSASFDGRRVALTDKTLLLALVSHPLQVLGILAGIHWEALKMLLKGFGLFPSPSPSGLARPRAGEDAA
ncbi:DUF1365 domain-containing protein [Caulobacter henricii]|uniref:DUF1365 domain-containing protein n=1 Tax=Caulobacter henricii TaxID=69395 RepID=A0A0P0NXN8_9CAUL|nr:DUF1365 family protein [Caulobacter henricii]ALL12678.1 hypothetical protein AQ619_04535 [Caulobacter henricii]